MIDAMFVRRIGEHAHPACKRMSPGLSDAVAVPLLGVQALRDVSVVLEFVLALDIAPGSPAA